MLINQLLGFPLSLAVREFPLSLAMRESNRKKIIRWSSVSIYPVHSVVPLTCVYPYFTFSAQRMCYWLRTDVLPPCGWGRCLGTMYIFAGVACTVDPRARVAAVHGIIPLRSCIEDGPRVYCALRAYISTAGRAV